MHGFLNIREYFELGLSVHQSAPDWNMTSAFHHVLTRSAAFQLLHHIGYPIAFQLGKTKAFNLTRAYYLFINILAIAETTATSVAGGKHKHFQVPTLT